MQDKIAELQQRCLNQIDSGLTKDLESSYIQAFALLRIADRLDGLVERQEVAEAAKHIEDARSKAPKSK